MKWLTGFGFGACILGVASLGMPAHAQEWPARPVKIVVAFGPGGTADTLGRIVAHELSAAFKQQFLVENKPGNSGAIGSAQVASSDADGYTLLIGGAGPHLVGPAVNANIGYETMRDFTHIGMIAGDTFMLAASPVLGVDNFAEFLKIARQKPISSGSPGAGSQGHLIQEIINKKTGAKLQSVPYRSAAEAMTNVIGGHVQTALQPAISVGEHVTAGKAVGLAVTSNERLARYGEVPTFVELGFDIRGVAWFWLAGPKDMPVEIVDKLNREIRRIVQLPSVKEQFSRTAMSTVSLDAAATRAFIADEVTLWGATAREIGLKVQ